MALRKIKRGHKAALALVLLAAIVGCSRGHEQGTASEVDRLFEKKLECGKLLARVEDSTLGPESRATGKSLQWKPVVFYSASLNTCVHLRRFVVYGETDVLPKRKYRVEYALVEDLLTGHTIDTREFDLTKTSEIEQSKRFEDEVLSKYR